MSRARCCQLVGAGGWSGGLLVAAITATTVVGVASPAMAALPTGPTTTGLTGSRPSATQLSFAISDQVTARVDVATGNLSVSNSSLSLLGVNAKVPIGQTYNSLGTTTISYSGANPTTVVSSAGPVAARTATFNYRADTYQLEISQSSGSLNRTIKYVKDANSNLVSSTDALGKTTQYAYTGSLLTSITAPTNAVTTFTYGAGNKITSIAQANTTGGSPGTSTTRLTYPTTTQTLVAGPNTDQAVAVASGPRTTYNFNATSYLVTSATDPMNRAKAAAYTPNADVASTTNGSGATAGTTTSTYGANSGESKTNQQSPGGSGSSASYANTDAATKYLPSSTSDDASNSSTYTYNGAGNALSSTNALAATATLTYNTDGTVATATAPGNGANKTVYSYNTTKQLSSITPVTGSSLQARSFTYDDLGRLRTETDGRGNTTTYSYDAQDRVTNTSFSDSTQQVITSYNDRGLVLTRQDGNGTTQYNYDQLGRLISRQNSFAGGLISYGYDRASNLTTTTDSRGTITYLFDASNTPTDIQYPKSSGTQTIGFTTDNQGRRTDTYLQTNAGRTVWASKTHNDYDTTGRVSRTIAQTGPATGPTTTLDISYCYNNATAAPTCSTTTTGDRAKLQWSKDNLTGQVTTYTYNNAGAITQVAQSGGSANNTWAYTYDSRGNRLTANVTGSNPSTQSFTVNAGNQITNTGYIYDGTGNLTTDNAGSYTYNAAQQMTTVTQGSTNYAYKYAGTSQNEVLQQQKAGTTYQLVYGRTDQQNQPIVEQVKIGADTAYVINDPRTGQPLALQSSTGTALLYVYNGTGNPVALLTDSSTVGYATTYDPYGVPTTTAGGTSTAAAQNPYAFKGGFQDRATGWVHYGARWYNPATGRWTQQDTLDTPLDPGNANRYSYAGNDPINQGDPSGKKFGTACAVTAGIFGGISFIASITAAVAGVVAAPVTGGLSTAATVAGVSGAIGIATGAPAFVLGTAGIFGNC